MPRFRSEVNWSGSCFPRLVDFLCRTSYPCVREFSLPSELPLPKPPIIHKAKADARVKNPVDAKTEAKVVEARREEDKNDYTERDRNKFALRLSPTDPKTVRHLNYSS